MSNERPVYKREEIIATESPLAQATIKATQAVLYDSLGLKVDLGRGKVRFREMGEINKEDTRQIRAKNELADIIITRGLPLNPQSNLTHCDALLMEDANGPYFGVSLEIGKSFSTIINPDSQRSKENVSRAAIYLFRNLSNAVVLNALKPVEIAKGEGRATSYFRDEMLKEIKQAAKGRWKREITEFASFMEDKTADPEKLSIVGLGADPILYLDGKPIFQVAGGSGDALNLTQYTIEPQFNWIMKRSDPRYVDPEKWEKIDNKDFLDMGEEIRRKAKEFHKDWDIPDSPREMFSLFVGGELARKAVEKVVKLPEGKTVIYEPTLLEENAPVVVETPSSKEPEDVADMPKQKKEKKKKKPAVPPVVKPLVFKKKVREFREPEVQKPPVAKIQVPIRHDPQPELIFETSEAARIRRQAEKRVQKEAERKERAARNVHPVVKPAPIQDETEVRVGETVNLDRTNGRTSHENKRVNPKREYWINQARLKRDVNVTVLLALDQVRREKNVPPQAIEIPREEKKVEVLSFPGGASVRVVEER